MALSTATSEVDICNLALTLLKQDLIAQIDPPKKKAEQLCALHYQPVRRATLRLHPWNHSIKRVTLTEDTGNVPIFGFDKAFRLPNDFVRYLTRHSEDGLAFETATTTLGYQIENGFILINDTFTDDGNLNLRYIFDNTAVSSWDALFVQLFAVNLAVAMAPNFSSSEARLAALSRMQVEIENKAQAIDGQERPPSRVERSKWLSRRRRGSQGAGPFIFFDGR